MRTSQNGYRGFHMYPSDRAQFEEVWQVHQGADWPSDLGSHEGPLMTLDTVIGGCVTYFFEEEHLDEQRVEILRDCLAELEGVVEDVSDPSSPEYFHRLQYLGTTLLQDYS